MILPTVNAVAEKKQEDSKTAAIKLPPDLQEVIATMREADPELNNSSAMRKALRHWNGDAPQAVDVYELWVLRALRRIKRHNPEFWATILGSLSEYAANAHFKEALPHHAEIADLAKKHRERSEDSGEVRTVKGRKTS